MAEALAVVGVVLPAIQAVTKFVLFCKEIYDVPEHVQDFARLLDRIRFDCQYARKCLSEAEPILNRMSREHRDWVYNVMNSMFTELIALSKHFPKFFHAVEAGLLEIASIDKDQGGETRPNLFDKLQTVMGFFPELERSQTAILTSHTSLLGAIGFLQQIRLSAEGIPRAEEAGSKTANRSPRPTLLASWAPPKAPATTTSGALALRSHNETDEE